ncbi:hypothetical protein J4E91_002801 [Alternaria rosae]|nr:hypothetical protein J4E91_002801 [Alternaria rosae]
MGHSSSKGRRRAWERVHRGVAAAGVELGDTSGTVGFDATLDDVLNEALDDALEDALGEGHVTAVVGPRTPRARASVEGVERGGAPDTVGLNASLDAALDESLDDSLDDVLDDGRAPAVVGLLTRPDSAVREDISRLRRRQRRIVQCRYTRKTGLQLRHAFVRSLTGRKLLDAAIRITKRLLQHSDALLYFSTPGKLGFQWRNN